MDLLGGRIENLEGFKNNNFTVLRKSDKRNSAGGVFWECQCICGTIKLYVPHVIFNTMPYSCGCIPKYEDMAGKKFNEFTVVRLSEKRNKSNIRLWECECSCGNIRYYLTSMIKRKAIVSCGCLGTPVKDYREKHPHEYAVWGSMKARCNNPKHPQYDGYGGRGIKVCERWQHSFKNFIEDMGGRPSYDFSIERKDNDKGYFPENCVWADATTQVNNRRLNKNNTSGVKGVSWNKRAQKWKANIVVIYKQISLGAFIHKEEAIKARRDAELKYLGKHLEY